MKRLIALLIAAMAIPALALGGLAHNHGDSSPEASPAATHGAGGTGTSAAYLTIANNGGEGDRLLGGSTDVAEIVEIHDMTIENDVMSMFRLEDGLEIPAGETVELKPQSLHVMLINLTRDLVPGSTFELTLRFERAGEITLTVPVGMEAPEDAVEVTAGDLVVSGVWARMAPMLGGGTLHATPMADH